MLDFGTDLLNRITQKVVDPDLDVIFPKCCGCMFMKFLGEVGFRIRNIRLDFRTDPVWIIQD